jgi:phospholipid-binding lipoprotein MlaA
MGQTFARWGAGSGPYIVLPLLGSSSLRDAIGFGANAALNPVNSNLETGEIIGVQLLRAEVALSLDKDTYEALYDSALDPYVFFRSAWTQNRQGAIER